MIIYIIRIINADNNIDYFLYIYGEYCFVLRETINPKNNDYEVVDVIHIAHKVNIKNSDEFDEIFTTTIFRVSINTHNSCYDADRVAKGTKWAIKKIIKWRSEKEDKVPNKIYN